MNESDIWVMPNWKRWLWGVRYEEFQTNVNTLMISWDQIPNPTSEERRVGKLPVEGRRYLAIHWPGKLVLRRLCGNNHNSPASLTGGGGCLEIYPLREGLISALRRRR